MMCDCVERIKNYNFKACCPEHQVAMDQFKAGIDKVLRDLICKCLTKLARGMIDDELVLSEEVITNAA